MPVSVGFHPYFKLTDSTRDEWTFSVPAKTHWILEPTKVPTGETEPVEQLFPNPQSAALKDYNLDDVFTESRARRAGPRNRTARRQEAATRDPARTELAWAGRVGAQSRRHGSRKQRPVCERSSARRRSTAECFGAGRPRKSGRWRAWRPSAGSQLHLLRAPGGHHQRPEPRAQRALQGPAAHSTGRHLAGEFLDQAERVLTAPGGQGGISPGQVAAARCR